jgi:8-oxo-dGTP pyrophosphatase MutT (NUDIX family)
MSSPAKDASTVMLLRESERGLEVYLTRRRDDLRFMGGFYVFPGGKVDTQDSSTDIVNLCANIDHISKTDPASDSVINNFDLSLMIAGCRELFEESGVLLAEDDDGNLLGFDVDPPPGLSAIRDNVNDGLLFYRALNEANLILRPDLLTYFSRWVTPYGSPIRYDARFFGALLPPGFTARYTELEATSDCWLTPDEALDRFYSGYLPMIPPTLEGIRSALNCANYSDWLENINTSPVTNSF